MKIYAYHEKSAYMILAVVLVFSICFPALSAADEGEDTDYFYAQVNRPGLLGVVEKYHFSENNFWKSFKAREYGYAKQELLYVLRYFPNHPGALQMLGSIAKITKSTSLPIPYYNRAIQMYPQYAITHAQYGDYLSSIGLAEEGISALKKAIEIDPSLAMAHAWLAKAYDGAKNFKAAKEESAKAIELGYKDAILDEDKKQESKGRSK